MIPYGRNEMPLYKHKDSEENIPVSAMRIGQETYAQAAVWCHGRVVKELKNGCDPDDPDSWQVGMNVPTMDGMARASEGDWVIRDTAGAFHIMAAAEFMSMFVGVEVSVPDATAPKGLKPRR